MQVPSILQGESLTRLLQGAAAGAVATMFVGFYWGGWSIASTADKMARERSELAVVAALAPGRLVEARGRVPQGIRDPPGPIVPEFRPCGRVLRAVACPEVSRAQLRHAPSRQRVRLYWRRVIHLGMTDETARRDDEGHAEAIARWDNEGGAPGRAPQARSSALHARKSDMKPVPTKGRRALLAPQSR